MSDCKHKGEMENLQKRLSAMTRESASNCDESYVELADEEEPPMRCGALQLLNAMGIDGSPPELGAENMIIVDVTINGKKARAMVDTGATHNFVTEDEAKRLGLKYGGQRGTLKTINSAGRPIKGLAKSVHTSIGRWGGQLNFTVVSMDGFNLVLGLDFLKSSKSIPVPHLNALMITGSQSCLVKSTAASRGEITWKGPYLSAMVLKMGANPRTPHTPRAREKAPRQRKQQGDQNNQQEGFNRGDIVKDVSKGIRFLRVQGKRLVRQREGPIRIITRFGRKAYKVEPLAG